MEEAVGLYESRIWERGLHWRSTFENHQHINAKVVMGFGEVTKGLRVDGEEKRPRTEPGTLQH